MPKPVVTFTSRPAHQGERCATCFETLLYAWSPEAQAEEVFVVTTRGLTGNHCRRCWWRTEVPHLESIGATVRRDQ